MIWQKFNQIMIKSLAFTQSLVINKNLQYDRDVIFNVFLFNENQLLWDGNIFQEQIKSKLVAESWIYMMVICFSSVDPLV